MTEGWSTRGSVELADGTSVAFPPIGVKRRLACSNIVDFSTKEN
jgi:hypothetical protein